MKLLINPMETFNSLNRSIPWTAEQRIELEPIARAIVIWQINPDIALINLTGIKIPPHERTMLYALHGGFPTNVVVGSRGTSKTAVTDVMYPGYYGTLFSKKKQVTLSSTGFRGGQLIFEDAIKWMGGGWQNQDATCLFMQRGLSNENFVKRAQNFWQIDFDSGSSNLTVPTNDPDKIRGLRGHLLFVDETNFIDWRLVSEVAENFLTVGTDFEHGGALSEVNQVFYTSTIDFSWRPFQEMIQAARKGIMRDMEAGFALKTGDKALYKDLRKQGLNGYQLISFDYTDCLIPSQFNTRDGRRYRVNYPNDKIPLSEDIMGIPFSMRDPTGGMQKQGTPIDYYQTYPIQKEKLEQKLYDGTAEESSWLAEQRNLVESSSGDVYAFELVSKAANEAGYSIRTYQNCSAEYKAEFANTKQDYTAPVLHTCTDPCVLGVDYAYASDFSAFVVIRLGPCAEGDYNYLTHHGKTTWCNVIWAEQHGHTSHKDVAEKIRELMTRYNIVWYDEPWITDTWEICRGIGLDMKGGGSGVRDELAYINDQTIDINKFRIYDPLDNDPRILAFARDPQSKPMLDAINPSPEGNDKMVTFTVSQMEQNLLYIGKYLEKSQRIRGKNELNIGYDGVLGLSWQLRKLRQETTVNWRKFYVEGDSEKTTNKKDYWSAFCYAAKQARAHIIRQRRNDDAPPATIATVAKINSGGTRYGRVRGSKDSFSRGGGYRRLL